jgi:DNA-binding YbaB/EbfC family protein
MSDQEQPGFDLGALVEQAQQLQQRLVEAQQEAAEQVHTGVSGGGAVTIEVTGGMEFRRVTIRPDVVDPDDVSILEDLVLAALHDAVGKAQEAQQDAMGGLGLGGIGGLLGGG